MVSAYPPGLADRCYSAKGGVVEGSDEPGRGLRWAIIPRFTAYVAGVPDGVIAASDGAFSEPGGFFFPRRGDGSFGGSVSFSAHAGVLNVLIADPAVESVGGVEQLTIRTGDGRMPVALLHPLDDGSFGARLTAEGSALFNYSYDEGAEIAPVRYS
jgi:hypothetical protein